MDTFTTTFSLPYPSPAPHTSSLAVPGEPRSNRAAGQYDPNTSYDDTATLPSLTTSSSTRSLGSLREHEHEHEGENDEGDKDKEGQVVQQLCRDIAAREGCIMTAIANQDDAFGFADSPKHSQRNIVSAAPATTTTWSFCIAGTQAAVLAAKGAVLREMPRDQSTTILAKRADILVSPYRYNSTLKPAVKARLDTIASTTNATICIPSGHTSGMYLYLSSTHSSSNRNDDAKSDTVPATPVLHLSQVAHGVRHVTSGSAGSLNIGMGRSFGQHRRSVSSIGQSTSASHRSYGSIESLVPVSADSSFEAMDDSMPYTGQLETEKMCEIVIGGDEGSVGRAKVGVLVMLAEMSGLHAQSIAIEHTLQPILAGRRGAILQNIQEETSTNIYLSASPLGARDVAPKPICDIAATSTLAPGRSVMPTPAPLVSPTSGTHIRPSHHPAGPPGLGYQAQAHMQQYGQYRSAPYQSYHPNPYAYPHQIQYDPNASYNQSFTHYSPLHPQAPAFQPGFAHAWATPGLYSTPSSFAARTSTPGYSGWSPNAHSHSHAASLSHSHGQGYVYGGGSNSSSPYMLNGAESTSSLSLYTPSSAGTPPQGMYRFRPEMLPAVPSDRRMHLDQAGAGSTVTNDPRGFGRQQDDEGVLAGKRVDVPPQSAVKPAGVRAGIDSAHVQEPVDRGLDHSMNEVWVTGEQAGVSRAIEMLKQLEMQKTPHVMSVTVISAPRKLDWLLLSKAEKLRAISYNNATYLQMPSVGSQLGSFTVIGDHRVGIERTIRQVMALTSQCVSATIWLLPQMPNGASTPIIDHEELRPVLRSIARDTSVEVVLKDVAMEVYGLEEQVKRAITTINDINMIQHISREIRFRIELANEHRDFITGKKNGKISKITKTANVKLKFEHSNDYTFILELSGAGAAPAPTGRTPIGAHSGQTNNNDDFAPTTGFFAGLQMLLDEMPAELSFHVPESHHKRIIGVQGKTIQAIMKDLGVYVKFSSADEHAVSGGYEENEDNVIARTPRKNGDKLERLKKAIMDLVLVKDRDYVKETLKVPGYYHRTLYGSKHVILRDIEKKTGTEIRFPPREDGRDEVVIYGPKGQLSPAKAMLLEHIPLALELRLEATEQLLETLASADFTSFIEQIKRERRTAISTQTIPPGAVGESVEEVVLLFKSPQSAAEQVGEAKDALMGWLAAFGIDPLNRSPTKRSQILRQQATRPSSRAISAANSSTSLDAPPTPRDPLRTRPASTTNVKALFEGTSPNNRFTMPLAALKNGASPDRGFLTMVGNKSPISVTAPNTANMWHHHASSHASKSSISGGGLPFMSATSAGFFEGRPDVLRRQQSLAALGSTYSALGLQTLSSASEHGDADDMTPRASVTNNGRVGTPPHVPVPAQIPVSGPRTRSSHYHHAPGASIGGLSLVNIHNSGDFTPFAPTAVDGLHDTTTTSSRPVHRFGGGHQRTATTADAGFSVPRGIPIERGRYAGPGPDYLGHQRDGHHGHGQGHGIGGRAQSLDITGFDYGRYMRPVTPAQAAPGVTELENEHGTQLAQSFDTFTLSDQ